MIKKLIMFNLLIFISLFNIYSQTNNDTYLLNRINNMPVITIIENVAYESTNMILYFKETDSALIIKDKCVTLKSTTLKLDIDIKVNDIINSLYSDVLFTGNSSVIILNNDEWQDEYFNDK